MSKTWWRVSCEEIGPTATESVLAIDACTAAADWAEGRGSDAEGEFLVEVTAETGDSGALVGDTALFRVKATIRWSAAAITCSSTWTVEGLRSRCTRRPHHPGNHQDDRTGAVWCDGATP